MFPLRFFPDSPRFDFIGKRLAGFVFSALLILGSIGLLAGKGLNFGIDFTGGVLMELRTEQPADLAAMRNLFADNSFGEVSLQYFGDEREVLIRTQQQEGDDPAALVERVKKKLAEGGYGTIDYRKTDFVGPTVGRELITAGALSLGLAVLAILLYIWFRFEWQYGLGAVIALQHDLIATLGFYALTGYDFGLPAIAAILTILGYSINDSVVIYDRVRENFRKYKKESLASIINRSLNETLSRTVLTGGTTLLALAILSVFGGEVLRGFSFAIFFGVVVGTYSSLFVAAPALLYFNLRDSSDEPAAQDHAEA